MCDETIYVMNILPTKLTNAIPTNVTSTMLTNSDHKKARRKMNCYILHTGLLVIILLLIIAIICYHYAKNWLKQKDIDTLTI